MVCILEKDEKRVDRSSQVFDQKQPPLFLLPIADASKRRCFALAKRLRLRVSVSSVVFFLVNVMKSRDTHKRPRLPPSKLPYCVRTAGWLPKAKYHSSRGTYHDDVMLTLTVGGRGIYKTRKETVSVETGMVGLVFPSDDVGLLMADADDPYDNFYCRFTGTEAVKTAKRILAANGGGPFFFWPRWQECAEAFRQLVSFRRGGVWVNPERVRPVEAMLAYVLSILDGASLPARGITAGQLHRYMGDHLAAPASLDEMAAHFGVSKPHLCRIARKLMGRTLVKAWQEMKIDWARVLLRDSALSVAEVGYRVGFNDPFYFSKVFKKHTGQSPSAWRVAPKRGLLPDWSSETR